MGGGVRIDADGFREDAQGAPGIPYQDAADRSFSPALIRLVPYHQWGNREPGAEMRVWLRSRE
jgi:DUF1680 family protein